MHEHLYVCICIYVRVYVYVCALYVCNALGGQKRASDTLATLMLGTEFRYSTRAVSVLNDQQI